MCVVQAAREIGNDAAMGGLSLSFFLSFFKIPPLLLFCLVCEFFLLFLYLFCSLFFFLLFICEAELSLACGSYAESVKRKTTPPFLLYPFLLSS